MKKLSLSVIIILLGIFCSAQLPSIKKCKLWNTSDVCNFPKNIRLSGFSSTKCTLFEISCKKIKEYANHKGVIVSIPKKFQKSFNLDSGFKNIKLIRKNNSEELYPIALLLPISHPQTSENPSNYFYISSNFQAETFHFFWGLRRYIDLFIIFPNAETGDKIIFENNFEAIIQ